MDITKHSSPFPPTNKRSYIYKKNKLDRQDRRWEHAKVIIAGIIALTSIVYLIALLIN